MSEADPRTDRIRVYVAGPYSSNPEGNTDQAIKTGQWLLEEGFAPMVPHLTHFWDEQYPNDWLIWLELDLPWVAQADCVFRMPGHSKGADIEVGYAKGLGIPVFYDVDSLVDNPPTKGDARFHAKLKKIGVLHDAKQIGYGTDNDPFANVRASLGWGIKPWIGALMRMCDKIKRLQNFAHLGHLPFESAQDNLEDVAVYSLIAAILLEEDQDAAKA